MPHPPDPLSEARDPATSPGRLHELLRHGPAVVEAVAANPSVSPATVEGLLGVAPPDRRQAVVDAFLGNPGLPLWLLADPDWLARFGHLIAMDMARSPRLTTGAWEALFRHPFSEVRWLLLVSPAAPPGAWQRYSGLSEPDTLATALATRLGDEYLAAVADRFAAHPDVPRELASGLVWIQRLPAPGVLALARSPALTPALWETLLGIGVDDPLKLPALALALARSPAAPPDAWSRLALPVTDGALRLVDVGDDDLRELARCPHLDAVTRLDLTLNRGIHDTGVEALAASPRLARIERLDLASTGVGDAGARALASASLPRLASLNLYRTQVGDEGLAALLGSRSLPALTELLLPDCRVTDEGARRLVASPRLATLTRLDLRLNHAIGESTWQALGEAAARHPGLTVEQSSR